MEYTIEPSAYAHGQMVIRCPSVDGWKSYAATLAGDILHGRYSRREGGYILSPTRARRFEQMMAAGKEGSA